MGYEKRERKQFQRSLISTFTELCETGSGRNWASSSMFRRKEREGSLLFWKADWHWLRGGVKWWLWDSNQPRLNTAANSSGDCQQVDDNSWPLLLGQCRVSCPNWPGARVWTRWELCHVDSPGSTASQKCQWIWLSAFALLKLVAQKGTTWYSSRSFWRHLKEVVVLLYAGLSQSPILAQSL